MKEKVGFIGLGLIGGSLAKAIRTYFPDYEIVAFDKNKEALALATQESVIDVAATTIDDNFLQLFLHIFMRAGCFKCSISEAVDRISERRLYSDRCRQCKN